MKIGLTEFILIFCIAAIAIGPAAVSFVRRWQRRARRTYKRALRRSAVAAIEARAEADELAHRFQKLGLAMALAAVLVLAYALLLRPVGIEPQPYYAPAALRQAGSAFARAESIGAGDYENIACVREFGCMIYFAAKAPGGGSVIARMNPDGSGLASIITSEDEITSFDFAPDEALWFTTVSDGGGALFRAGHDGWGAAAERVVTQIDGAPLACPAAIAIGADGNVYFADAASLPAGHGSEAVLRSELIAHTASGAVYVYDPASRAVQTVMVGLAGASGLALSPDGGTLYISDMGARCVWAIDPAARELTAGGKNCRAFASGLPGYPGALTADEDGCVYVSFRWGAASWLEAHSRGTILRRAALRLPQRMQAGLFAAPNPCAESFDPNGAPLAAFGGDALGSASAVYVSGSRVYIGLARGRELKYVRI